MDKDYYNFGIPPYYGYEANIDPNISQGQQQSDANAVFNPIMQYEQAYMYYRYLAQQMEYKIKCKEYEKLNNSENSRSSNSRKIE